MNATGRPVQELTDEELEAQGTFTGTEEDSTLVVGNPVRCLLTKLAEQPGGRMHKLELHQAARECGLTREALAAMYNKENQFLVADRFDRVLTEKGRDYLARAVTIASP